MPIPSSEGYADLRGFLNLDNLAFRAACNAVVPPERQPLPTKAIQKILRAPRTERVMMRLWDPAHPVREDNFASALAEDLSWRTLVLEELFKLGRWSALLSKLGMPDGMKKRLKKVWDDSAHASATTASAIVLTVVGINTVDKLHPGLITIPVLVKPVSGPNIPLTFKAEMAGEPPRLRLAPPEQPLLIMLDLKPNDIRKALGVAPTVVTAAPCCTRATDSAFSTALLKVYSGVSTQLDGLNANLKNLQVSLDSAAGEQQKKADALNAGIAALGRATQRNVISVVMAKGTSRSVVLPYIDGNLGESSGKPVELVLDYMGKDSDGNFVNVTWTPEGGPRETHKLYEGISQPLIDNPLYRITLSAKSRKLLISRMAELTIVSQAKPERKDPPTSNAAKAANAGITPPVQAQDTSLNEDAH